MKLNRFSLKVVIQVVLIAITCYVFIWSLSKDHLVVSKATFGGVLIFQIYYLIRYVNATNRRLQHFLQSLRYLDAIRESAEQDRSFRELNLTYNQIIDQVRKMSLEKESEHHYFRNTVEHVGVGLISFDANGKVELINEAAKKLLRIRHLYEIKGLNRCCKELVQTLLEIKPRQQRLLKLKIGDELVSLALRATVFIIQNRRVKLVSLQNIKTELEEEELDAWQRLISVLTHEIMNSVTPIKSLTSTIIKMYERDSVARSPGEIDYRTICNTLEGLHAIDKRSKGLINFVQSYRSLTKIPKPSIKEISLVDIFQNVQLLMESDLRDRAINFEYSVESEELQLMADEKLIMQILLNLMKNSMQALEGKSGGKIQLHGYRNNDHILLQVRDNGEGIPKEIIDKIFIPFYTTKENGTGIGLSLSRQIMRLHNGTINVNSNPGVETVFTLKF
jgi:nitrogen fixation/metabolism regulation signal transduction histidine kinase